MDKLKQENRDLKKKLKDIQKTTVTTEVMGISIKTLSEAQL